MSRRPQRRFTAGDAPVPPAALFRLPRGDGNSAASLARCGNMRSLSHPLPPGEGRQSRRRRAASFSLHFAVVQPAQAQEHFASRRVAVTRGSVRSGRVARSRPPGSRPQRTVPVALSAAAPGGTTKAGASGPVWPSGVPPARTAALRSDRASRPFAPGRTRKRCRNAKPPPSVSILQWCNRRPASAMIEASTFFVPGAREPEGMRGAEGFRLRAARNSKLYPLMRRAKPGY